MPRPRQIKTPHPGTHAPMLDTAIQPPLTRADVIQAIVAVVIRGEIPTTDKVWESLGRRGSRETVSKYLTHWLETDLAMAVQALVSQPHFVKGVGTALLSMVYREKGTLGAQLEEAEEERRCLAEEVQRLQAERNAYQAQVTVKDAEILKMQGMADELRRQVGALASQAQEQGQELAVARALADRVRGLEGKVGQLEKEIDAERARARSAEQQQRLAEKRADRAQRRAGRLAAQQADQSVKAVPKRPRSAAGKSAA